LGDNKIAMMKSIEIEKLIVEFRNAAIEKGDFVEAKRDKQLY